MAVGVAIAIVRQARVTREAFLLLLVEDVKANGSVARRHSQRYEDASASEASKGATTGPKQMNKSGVNETVSACWSWRCARVKNAGTRA